jgi:hypothetical protein
MSTCKAIEVSDGEIRLVVFDPWHDGSRLLACGNGCSHWHQIVPLWVLLPIPLYAVRLSEGTILAADVGRKSVFLLRR